MPIDRRAGRCDMFMDEKIKFIVFFLLDLRYGTVLKMDETKIKNFLYSGKI